MLRALTITTALFMGSITSVGIANPLTEPAAPITGLRTNGKAPFDEPLFGPKYECLGTKRQLIILNPKLVAGEPLMVRLNVERISSDSLDTEFMLQRSFSSDLHVEIISPNGGRPYRYQGMRLGTTVPTATVKMDSVHSVNIDMRMAMDNESITGAAFDIPGTYRVRFMINCRSRSAPPNMVEAGIFEIEVAEATGDDAKALAILDDYEVFKAFEFSSTSLSGFDLINDAQAKKIARIIDEAPQSRLRPYAMAITAKKHQDKEEYSQSLLLLRQLQADYPKSIHGDSAYFEELRLLTGLGQIDGSWEAFKRGWEDPYLTMNFFTNSAHYERYVKHFLADGPGSQWMLFEEPGDDPIFLTPDGREPVETPEGQDVPMSSLPADFGR